MIKVENIEPWGFEHAIRGMRNPLQSWDKSDSRWEWVEDPSPINPDDPGMMFVVGENDLNLMRRLYRAGTEHRKYLRQIFVSMDITAPLYWWKEMDQYKVGTVTDSCSTMHKIAEKEFTVDDFSHEHLLDTGMWLLETTIDRLNKWRSVYVLGNQVYEPKNKEIWWQLIQLLPSSYNQRRTLTMNYENVVTIMKQRSNHKLDEWRTLVNIFYWNLPYIKEIMEDGTEA